MESVNFHQPVSTSRVRASTLLSSLPTNIVNEILDIINQELKNKIAIYRDQMLTYAQEIDEKLSNCKDSRNKYYQICQQLTTKYSKLKKKYEHLYTRYQSYKGRNKELFTLLQYLSAEDIRVQHQILKYQSKYRNAANQANAHNLNINTININANTNREPSPSISAISSPSYNNGALTMVKRHSKSKTATSIPFRNSLLINDPHKLLTHQPSAISAAAKHSNPFSGYYNNSYKRNSNSERSHASRSTMSIHENDENEENDERDELFNGKREREQSNIDDAYGISLKHDTKYELEGYHDTTLNQRKQKKQKQSRYSSTVQTPPVTMRQSNLSDEEVQSTNSSLQIQPVAMPASLFINNEYNKMNSGHLHPIYSPKIVAVSDMRKKSQKSKKKEKRRYKKQRSIAKNQLLANVLRADNDDIDEFEIANGTMFRKHHLRELNSMIVNASSDDDEYEHEEEEEEDHDIEDEEEEDAQNTHEILTDEHHDTEHMLNSNSDHHDNQASGSSTKQDRNSSNIDYSRSHSSSMLSGFTDEDQTRTQQFYYEQLKLTPVPTKRVIDKNRLIGILQNLPTDEDVNRATSSNDTPIEDVMDENNAIAMQHHPETGVHSRNVSSNMSFPDIDKINNNNNDNSKSSSSASSQSGESEQHLPPEEQTNDNEIAESEYSNNSEQEMRDVVPQMNEKFSNKNNKHNSHIRSSTFGSQPHDDKIERESKKRSKSNNGNIVGGGGQKVGKTIKLFYRFGTKSFPPIMAKTTNTIQQLKALIASCLHNVDANKLQLAHRQRVLNDMDLTLSQCDIAQYDTIIVKIDTTRRLFPDEITEKGEVINMVISPRVNSTKSTNTFAFNEHHHKASYIAPINTKMKSHSSHGKKLWTPNKTPHSAGSINSPYANSTPPARRSLKHSNSNKSHKKKRKKKRKSPPVVTISAVRHNEEEEYEEEEDEDDDIGDDEEEESMIDIADNIHNHSLHSSLHSRRPLFGISRPVSMRKYDDSIEYPLSVCPASIAVQSPRSSNKTQQQQKVFDNNHLLSPRQINKKKKKTKKKNNSAKRVRRAPRVRFSNDTQYKVHDPAADDHNLLELRRNLSRSLDVRIEDNLNEDDDKQHRNGAGVQYHHHHNGGDAAGSFSPLPSRRRTQKLENPPLIQLMNTTNCKKSKSLSISKNKMQKKKNAQLKRNKLKTRSFSTKTQRKHAPKHNHNHHMMAQMVNRVRVTSVDDDDEEEEDDEDDDHNERLQQAMELQRNVSREDLESGDDISIDNFPNYDDRERRKTIEIGKPPLK